MNIKNKTAGHAGIACFSFALKGNRAGSPHFKIVRFKWWEHVTDSLKAKERKARLQYMSYRDMLTTLYNRTGIFRFWKACRQKQ